MWRIETFVNNERYILNENDGIFINSGVIHKYGSGIENTVCIMPKDNGCDFIVALGGAVLDSSKAIAAMAAND